MVVVTKLLNIKNKMQKIKIKTNIAFIKTIFTEISICCQY